jgi:chloramphenicol-sensitive protein RarD
MATLGIVQYLGPSIQFVIGVWIFHEPLTSARLIGFGCIWLALLIYSVDGWNTNRSTVQAAAAS